MQYRPLGNTGITVSEIGFGCGNTAGAMIWGAKEARLALVRRALDAGITHFDTAPNYGDGVSETNLGEALRELGASPTVATKVEFLPRDFDDVPGAIERSVRQSLARLGRESVDLVYLHNRVAMQRSLRDGPMGSTLSVDDVLGKGGALEALERLRSAGAVRFLGFCPGGDAGAIRQVIQSGAFHCIQVTYNTLNPTEGRTPPAGFADRDYGQSINLAGEMGVGVVVIRALAAGTLSGEAPHPLSRGGSPRVTDAFVADQERAQALRFLTRDGRSLAQAALQFVLAKPEVSTVLVGFSDEAQVDEAVACGDGARLSADELARIEALYASDFGRRG